MNRLPSSISRPLIRIVYLLPLIFGGFMLTWVFVPHLFFLQDGDPKVTQSLFDLLSGAWTTCTHMWNGEAQISPDAMYFPYVVGISVILSWICMALYALVAIPAALCSFVAFAYPPESRPATRAKKWMQFFCPNRAVYVLLQLAVLFPACFPQIEVACLRTMMAMNVTVHPIIGLSDHWLIGILVAVSLGLWLLLLPAQASEKMDLFRIFKPASLQNANTSAQQANKK